MKSSLNAYLTAGISRKTIELLEGTDLVMNETSETLDSSKELTSKVLVIIVFCNQKVALKFFLKAYLFDGQKTAITIAPDLIKPQQLEKSTISFWMRHGEMQEGKVDKTHLSKENILCSSDESSERLTVIQLYYPGYFQLFSEMKRHHFALFVRNCKLELLIRRESMAKKPNSFKPAEWRWKLAEVCDNKWHQYSISINNLSVSR